jgi:hypothetical protein
VAPQDVAVVAVLVRGDLQRGQVPLTKRSARNMLALGIVELLAPRLEDVPAVLSAP